MSYLGSKGQSGVFQRIIGNMPPHTVYVEPFLGSGQVFERKNRAKINILIDSNADCLKGRGLMISSNGICDWTNNAIKTKWSGLVPIVGDAVLILPKLELPSDAVVYCDPPYLLSTRTSRHRYKHEFTVEQHEHLLTLLQALECRVLLSGYPSELYTEKLRGWRCDSYRTRTRGRTVTECLWCNFPEPTELHDWRFAGKSHRERLTLKRRVTRLVYKFDRMEPMTRNLLLNAIQQRYFQRQATAAVAGKDVAR